MSDSNIVQKVNKSSLGSRQARTLRASVSVTRARSVIAQAQAKQTPHQPGGSDDGTTKR
ncbi:hypothetical protein BN11_4590003 [Nostocoides australiense Ben110]|uniref:Uncharacterized protein n=1 Tax=Nostocoides australiense Ben110 TaxID=1193182 RepID=W6K482_9MICO|nr:hypothetical protein BN11_3220019 [Tetrasphaera australiensis Ben110]CCH74559.1 hypothetical protein BN11_4580003 [Tetrasphaera australiensis Ben110]CCH74579.1 hypothetical protein BN11_4590003 [Tetrasphaera australiensis Ben110]